MSRSLESIIVALEKGQEPITRKMVLEILLRLYELRSARKLTEVYVSVIDKLRSQGAVVSDEDMKGIQNALDEGNENCQRTATKTDRTPLPLKR